VKRSLCALALAALACSFSPARLQADASGQILERLAGTWKENLAKRKLAPVANLRFRTDANGQLEELRGPDERPVIQPVRFDGKAYQVDSGNTIVWKQSGPDNYERSLSNGGKLLTVRRIRISSDGKQLTEEYEQKTRDGKTTVRTTEFQKASGESKGLWGTWKATSVRDSEPGVVTYERAGPAALKVTGRYGQTNLLTLDGKPAPVSGPAVLSKLTVSGRQIDTDAIETTLRRDGALIGNSTLRLSNGGKVLTMTTRPVTGGESIQVFDKQ
jgi:hypothetical protein